MMEASYGSGEVALFAAESVDGLEPELFFQVIGDIHAYSAHFNHHRFLFYFLDIFTGFAPVR
jgi:hypothetical protein